MSLVSATAVLCIAVGGVGAQWLAGRLRLPAIVLLFAFGLLVGPVLQILQPTDAFGTGVRSIVGLAVAIVVFEGGLAATGPIISPENNWQRMAQLTVQNVPLDKRGKNSA